MSASSPSLPLNGPNAGDCRRLLATIRAEFIPDARIEIRPVELAPEKEGLVIELLSEGVTDQHGQVWTDVWATKTFANPLHLISTAQLYDLLIVGYKQIDRYFEHGEAYAPARR